MKKTTKKKDSVKKKTKSEELHAAFGQKMIETLTKMEEEGSVNFWSTPWFNSAKPMSGSTGKTYRGMNQMWLRFAQEKRGSEDPRWYTFNYIADRDGKYHPKQKWHLKADSHGEVVEYYELWNYTKKCAVRTAADRQKAEEDGDKVWLRSFTSYVFNGADIEGLPPYEVKKCERKDLRLETLVEKIDEGLGLKSYQDQLDRAFYVPSKDEKHTPKPENFKSPEEFASVNFHESSHATGHASRLNRNLKGFFGNEEYAFEELIAELSACMIADYCNVGMAENRMNNSISYLHSWKQAIEKDSDALVNAVKQATKAADYIIENAGLEELLRETIEESPADAQ